MEGMTLPIDTNRNAPNCGVVATAIAAGVSYFSRKHRKERHKFYRMMIKYHAGARKLAQSFNL